MSILKRALGKIVSKQQPAILSDRDFIRAESKIGGQLFGPIPKGHRREFFCLDEHTWVWYESVIDPMTKKESAVTTRYEIRGDRIIKIQDGQPHKYTSIEETRNLVTAMENYFRLVTKHIYSKAHTAQ